MRTVRNPLTLIGSFAALTEAIAATVLPFLSEASQAKFVWFVMLFPVLLVVLFFVTLNWNVRVLYAPSDYSDQRYFVDSMRSGASLITKETGILKTFWKPDGVTIDEGNETRLKEWMRSNRISTASLTFFLLSDVFQSARLRAVEDLGLKE